MQEFVDAPEVGNNWGTGHSSRSKEFSGTLPSSNLDCLPIRHRRAHLHHHHHHRPSVTLLTRQMRLLWLPSLPHPCQLIARAPSSSATDIRFEKQFCGDYVAVLWDCADLWSMITDRSSLIVHLWCVHVFICLSSALVVKCHARLSRSLRVPMRVTILSLCLSLMVIIPIVQISDDRNR